MEAIVEKAGGPGSFKGRAAGSLDCKETSAGATGPEPDAALLPYGISLRTTTKASARRRSSR